MRKLSRCIYEEGKRVGDNPGRREIEAGEKGWKIVKEGRKGDSKASH